MLRTRTVEGLAYEQFDPDGRARLPLMRVY